MNPISIGGPAFPASTLKIDDFKKFEALEGKSGRFVVSGANSRTPELTVAKYTFKERVLAYLSNVPLFQNLESVKNNLASINARNHETIQHFLGALSATYGEDAAEKVASGTLLKFQTADLNEQTITKALAIAERFKEAVSQSLPQHQTAQGDSIQQPSPASASDDDEDAFGDDMQPELVIPLGLSDARVKQLVDDFEAKYGPIKSQSR